MADDGFTHASTVIPVVRSREGESSIVTHAFVPLNDSPDPNLPLVVQVAPAIVPVLAWPDESSVRTPTPSLNPYAATRPGWAGGTAGGSVGTVFDTDTVTDACAWLPALSRATAVSVWRPSADVAVFHVMEYGGEARSAPKGEPSTKNCTPATPTSSAADAMMAIDPDTAS